MTRTRIAAALAALALAASAGPAVAADPETFVGHAANWVERQGFDVNGKPAVHVHDTEAESAEAWVWDGPAPGASSGLHGVSFYASFARQVRDASARYGTRGRMTRDQLDAARVTLHELLHREGHDDWYRDERRERIVMGHPMSWWEEAITEAVTLDLLPSFTRELFGFRPRPALVEQSGSLGYRPRMTTIRQMSRFATGDRTWRGRNATAWRADVMRASYPARARMLEDAYYVRAIFDERGRCPQCAR